MSRTGSTVRTRRTSSMREDGEDSAFEYTPVANGEGTDPESLVNTIAESPSKPPPDVSLGRIYLLCIINLGISATWSLEMALTTPYFASALRSGPVLSHVVWVLGPVSGLVVAPIVGFLSDKCTSPLGRRRPFVIVGAIGTISGLVLFPNVRQIASRIFSISDVDRHHKAALVLAVFSFALMDFSINTTMFPVRALQGDLVPQHQQHLVQSASVVMGSLGDFLISNVIQAFENPVENIRALFAITACLYLFSSTVLLYVAKEERYVPKGESITSDDTKSCSFAPIAYVRSIPGWLWRVGGVFALGFFSFFVMLPNFSEWLGASVLSGNPSAKLGTIERANYELGVQAVGRAGAIRAGLSIFIAAAYPRLLRAIGAPGLLALAFGTYGVISLVLAGTHTLSYGQFMVACYSLPMTILFTIPMAITVKKSSALNRGKHLGILNCFAVVPQLIDTTYTGYISKYFGEDMVMRIGGAWSLLAALFAVMFVRE